MLLARAWLCRQSRPGLIPAQQHPHLHAFNIVPFQRDEARWISFEVHPLQNDRSVVIRRESPVLEQRGVRNTSGITETRYVIREQLVLGEGELAD